MSKELPNLDLRPDHMDIVRDVLRRHVSDRKVLAFGSRVTWTAKHYSDLDLAVLGDEPLPLDLTSALAESFDDSDLPFKVDVVDWASTSESFREVIEKNCVMLVEKVNYKSPKRPTRRLCDVADIIMGQSPPGETVSGFGGLALLNGPTEFGAHHPKPVQFTTDARRCAQKDDLLFCVRGSTTGRMNWADQKYAIGRGVASIRHRYETALQPFVRAVIEFGLPELLAEATGSTFPNVSADQLASIPLPDIDIVDQRAIAHILGTLDDKIELNRRMNETLEAMARALFKSWFVDFEPVRARMEGRDTGLPSHIADLFPDRLVESELGEIPEGWEVRVVSDFASIKGGKQLPKDKFVDNGPMPIFGGAGLMGYTDDYNADGYVITVGRVGAYCGQFFAYQGRAWVNNNASIIAQHRSVSGEWLLLSLRNLDIDSIKKGAAQPFISNSDLGAMRIIAPVDTILNAFRRFSEPLFRRLAQSQNESKILIGLRNALLPKLVSGELRVGSRKGG